MPGLGQLTSWPDRLYIQAQEPGKTRAGGLRLNIAAPWTYNKPCPLPGQLVPQCSSCPRPGAGTSGVDRLMAGAMRAGKIAADEVLRQFVAERLEKRGAWSRSTKRCAGSSRTTRHGGTRRQY